MLRAGLWPGCTCRHSAPRNAALLFWRAGFAQDSGDEYEGDPAREKMFLESLRPEAVGKRPPLTPEEKAENARRAKEYSRLKMAEHRAWQQDLRTKLALKQAAIAALPEELRADCLTFDVSECPPLNRNIFTHTPPIKDFQVMQRQRRKGQRGGAG